MSDAVQSQVQQLFELALLRADEVGNRVDQWLRATAQVLLNYGISGPEDLDHWFFSGHRPNLGAPAIALKLYCLYKSVLYSARAESDMKADPSDPLDLFRHGVMADPAELTMSIVGSLILSPDCFTQSDSKTARACRDFASASPDEVPMSLRCLRRACELERHLVIGHIGTDLLIRTDFRTPSALHCASLPDVPSERVLAVVRRQVAALSGSARIELAWIAWKDDFRMTPNVQ